MKGNRSAVASAAASLTLWSACFGGFLAGSVQAQRPPSNFDEAKVGSYRLPDPLEAANGRKIVTIDQWTRERRPELLRLFASEVYGAVPHAAAQVKPRFQIRSEKKNALGGIAIRREIRIYLTDQDDGLRIDLVVYIPAGLPAGTRVPAFLGLNFRGNHTIEADATIALSQSWMRESGSGVVDHRATESSRGSDRSSWPVEQIISRGYALATFYYGDIDPDYDDGFQNGIHPLFFGPREARPQPDEWGSIAAWAWGLSRALDYLESEPRIDPDRIALMGHSRLGKTALWAGALDARFDLVVSVQSGCGGAALSRRNFGETVEQINTSFPHWFCTNFRRYNSNERELPVDQHELIALLAPRPVLICSAQDDLGADPKGEFLAALAADPVYRLLGTDGLAATELPKPAPRQLIKSTIGFHYRPGKHQVTLDDWEAMLEFADAHFRH
jgi:hypothetical protein